MNQNTLNPDYKSLYFMLFNRITDLQQELIKIQQQAEDAFLALHEEGDTDESTNL